MTTWFGCDSCPRLGTGNQLAGLNLVLVLQRAAAAGNGPCHSHMERRTRSRNDSAAAADRSRATWLQGLDWLFDAMEARARLQRATLGQRSRRMARQERWDLTSRLTISAREKQAHDQIHLHRGQAVVAECR